MHVDGFRFDLASILTRNADGTVNHTEPPLLSEISLIGHYGDLSLTAEAWDLNLYQLGTAFPAMTWRQWNGKFRDDIRSWVRGEPGKVGSLMQRLYGSDDLFPDSPIDTYRPYQSVNFVTAHDGFCMYDLVTYNQKHNEINGHSNTDGLDNNLSWNCGHEGDAGAPEAVLTIRRRQVRNFFTLLMLANGTPMFYAGDEFMHTQQGNNNPYNQDNEISWLDWDRLKANHDVFRFVRMMIAFRKSHPSICRSHFWREDVRWYGAKGDVDMTEESRHLAYCLLGASQCDDDLYVMINSKWESQEFTLQEGTARDWKRVIDTARESPNDILDPGKEKRLTSNTLRLAARSVVVLVRKYKG
jgi:glycogen operon protein